MSLLADLAAALDDLAARGAVMAYGDLARALAIPGPGSIAKLSTALETLMAEDAANGRPLRAVVCVGRLSDSLPAPGFFEAAQRLGRFDGADRASFVSAERAALFKAAHAR